MVLSLLFACGCLYVLFSEQNDLFGELLYKMGINNAFDEICIIGLSASLLLTAFSREKDEDECIGNLRLKALAWAVYASCGLQFVATWCLYDLSYLYFSFSAFASVLVFFILIYQWMLYRFRRENHE